MALRRQLDPDDLSMKSNFQTPTAHTRPAREPRRTVEDWTELVREQLPPRYVVGTQTYPSMEYIQEEPKIRRDCPVNRGQQSPIGGVHNGGATALEPPESDAKQPNSRVLEPALSSPPHAPTHSSRVGWINRISRPRRCIA